MPPSSNSNEGLTNADLRSTINSTITGHLDVSEYMVVQNPSIPSPAFGNPTVADFPLPYGDIQRARVGNEGNMGNSPYIDLGHSLESEHRGSVSSITAAHRASFSSVRGVVGNSLSGSDQASPSSLRASVTVDVYVDDFGTIDGMVDEEFPGSKEKGEIPPWTELKTKAGKERKRLPLACIACRRKKIRCSGEKPACSHCLRSRIPCVYRITARKAAPRTDYMAMLDKRLKRMEERIIKIVPKEEQDNTVTSITRANVKPPVPGTVPARASKKRPADAAFTAELDEWSRQTPNIENNSRPRSIMTQDAEEIKLLTEGAEALPSKEIQEHLAEIFFENVYGQTYHVLHKPSFMRKLK